MKNTGKIILLSGLALAGGFAGQQLSTIYSNSTNPISEVENSYQNQPLKTIPVNMEQSVKTIGGFSDLTYASEKTVKSVAHIQTHFVREEITYDPLMKLFYGQDAYKIRERHGQSSGSGVVISKDGYIVTN
ncbi:MAG: hypothetical protein AB8F94_22235, partial [Saprospiraceae bacterium]